MKKFLISENEKTQILNMHYQHFKIDMLNEQQNTTDRKILPCAKNAEEIINGKALLYVGCKNNFVKEFQERIASAGRSGVLAGNKIIGEKGSWGNPTDGNFGSRTKKSTIDFQKEMGLKPDGVVGKSTWEKVSAYKPEITFDVNSKTWVFKDTFEPVDTSWYSGKERSKGYIEPIQVQKINDDKPEMDIVRTNMDNKGSEKPEETKDNVPTENHDFKTLESLSKELVKQEGDKYTAWGMGTSPDQSFAYHMATVRARSKINKNYVSEVDRAAYKDNNGNYTFFVKMSTQ